MNKLLIIILLMTFSVSYSMDYSEADFVGKWTGTIESEWNGYYKTTNLELFEDGTYHDESGHLMPTLYPNTQKWRYDEETNRLIFEYLKVVYAGQKSYTYIMFEVVNFDEEYLELHYNFWDDPEPQPDAQKMVLTRNTTSVTEKTNINSNRELIRVTDITGKEVPEKTLGIPLIYQYNDGTIEKIVIE